MVKVGVIGTGFVGLTHAAVTAMYGHNIIGYDSNSEKVDAFNSGERFRIEKYVAEKNLADIVNKGLKEGNLSFSTNPEVLTDREVLFMCLPTPYKDNGESDLKYFFSAADSILPVLLRRSSQDFILFADKSTVPIGTANKLQNYLSKNGLINFDVASNPEFLPEGDAVESAIHSHKVVVGANHQKSFDLFKRVYSNFLGNGGYIETNPETAEAIKYASNALLFTQIVAWQAIPATIGEAFSSVEFDAMKRGILADKRIASWGSYVSAGAGGSCFKKDALSLSFQLNHNDADASFVSLINDINEQHKSYLIERAEKEANYDFNKKCVVILGTAFKQDTNDMRESNVLKLVPELLKRGVEEIRLYDPLALDMAKIIFNPNKNQNFNRISYYSNVESAVVNADVSYVATDHKEFRNLGDKLLKNVNLPHLIIDGRRMISTIELPALLERGMSYLPIGGTYKTK